METDILGGLQMGYHTILVLSGGTKRSDLSEYAYQPDRVIDSVADLCAMEFNACNIPVLPARTIREEVLIV